MLTCEKTDEKPSNSIFNKFTGRFIDPEKNNNHYVNSEEELIGDEISNSVCDTYGFINSEQTYDSIYVHKSLVHKYQLKHNYKVQCDAVYSAKRSGEDGWKAISIEKLNEQK